MSSGYRGEGRPRRQPPRHHVETSASAHEPRHHPMDPFPSLSSKQFPAQYQRDPVKNQYRRFMRAKQAYKKPRF
jgi:hypothetical protein